MTAREIVRRGLYALVRSLPQPLRNRYWRLALRRPRFDVGYRPGFGRFWSPWSIAERIAENLSAKERAFFRSLPSPRDTIRLHHGFGTWVRNEFGLWRPANPYTRSIWARNDARDPDAVSTAILEAVWHRVTGHDVPPALAARLLGVE